MTTTMPRAPERLRIVALAAVVLAGCSQQPDADARYAADQCRRVALVDVASGAAIRGAEDFAVDVERERLYVSAYDRRSVERAVRRKASAIPQGGVYAVSLAALIGDAADAAATPVVRADDITGGLRPHGISFSAAAGEIAFINRGYQRSGGRWRMVPRVERVGARGEVVVGEDVKTPCSANDLVDEPGEALISFDHERCDWRGGLEDTLSLRRSGVVAEDGAPLFDKALFANGIARMRDGRIALAATREKALLVMDERAGGLELSRRIAVPGGPDNLTIAADGDIIAAVHPSLFLMGLHRRLGVGAAPSRIVRVDPATDRVEVLFDDPDGALYSAATVAAEWKGALIAGSVTDDGLLVCKAAG